MEPNITDHLRDLFKPVAIILHGSRAIGRERLHSDWDTFLLYDQDQELPKNGRLIWQEQNIEHSHHHLPVLDIEKVFGVKLQFGRVLFERESEATDLLTAAKSHYGKPAGWSEEDSYGHGLWMLGRLDGMRDTVDQPLVFERYASDFYTRITNYWYWCLHDTYPKPIYVALEDIEEKDPDYFALLEQFVSGTRVERVQAAEAIYQRCFKN